MSTAEATQTKSTWKGTACLVLCVVAAICGVGSIVMARSTEKRNADALEQHRTFLKTETAPAKMREAHTEVQRARDEYRNSAKQWQDAKAELKSAEWQFENNFNKAFATKAADIDEKLKKADAVAKKNTDAAEAKVAALEKALTEERNLRTADQKKYDASLAALEKKYGDLLVKAEERFKGAADEIAKAHKKTADLEVQKTAAAEKRADAEKAGRDADAKAFSLKIGTMEAAAKAKTDAIEKHYKDQLADFQKSIREDAEYNAKWPLLRDEQPLFGIAGQYPGALGGDAGRHRAIIFWPEKRLKPNEDFIKRIGKIYSDIDPKLAQTLDSVFPCDGEGVELKDTQDSEAWAITWKRADGAKLPFVFAHVYSDRVSVVWSPLYRARPTKELRVLAQPGLLDLARQCKLPVDRPAWAPTRGGISDLYIDIKK